MQFRNFTTGDFGIQYSSDFPKVENPILDLMAKKIQEHFPEQSAKELNFDSGSKVLPMVSVEDAIRELEALEKNQNPSTDAPKIDISAFQ